MIKGCQKKIIHLKNPDSRYFEEAYFILKETTGGITDEKEMIKEAERIAKCNNIPSKKESTASKGDVKAKALTVILSCVCAVSFIFGVLMLCIALCP